MAAATRAQAPATDTPLHGASTVMTPPRPRRPDRGDRQPTNRATATPAFTPSLRPTRPITIIADTEARVKYIPALLKCDYSVPCRHVIVSYVAVLDSSMLSLRHPPTIVADNKMLSHLQYTNQREQKETN